MALTKDQKHALYVGGGAIAVIIIFYLLNQNNPAIPGTATALPPSPDGLPGPSYMDYNVGGLNAPPSLAPQAVPGGIPASMRCGCNDGNDGCFSSSPLDTGRGPVTLDQLVNWYADYHPGFQQYVQQAQAPYAIAPQTLSEQAQPGLAALLSLTVPSSKRLLTDVLY